jgi:predicted translin family RNA/ssDNA-binding protein
MDNKMAIDEILKEFDDVIQIFEMDGVTGFVTQKLQEYARAEVIRELKELLKKEEPTEYHMGSAISCDWTGIINERIKELSEKSNTEDLTNDK